MALGLFREFNMTETHQPNGLFHFLNLQLPFLGLENCLRLNFSEFMSQTIIYSRAYWLLKIWLSIPLYE